MKLKLIVILMLLLCASPVTAVTYSEEYYTLGSLIDKYFSNLNVKNEIGYNLDWSDNAGNFASLASARELRRQTILLEKQNEILQEQVKAQWVETCYAPIPTRAMGNYSAWKSECVKAGYPVG
jgi:hypothetical protein